MFPACHAGGSVKAHLASLLVVKTPWADLRTFMFRQDVAREEHEEGQILTAHPLFDNDSMSRALLRQQRGRKTIENLRTVGSWQGLVILGIGRRMMLPLQRMWRLGAGVAVANLWSSTLMLKACMRYPKISSLR